jgi:hypothetical protein
MPSKEEDQKLAEQLRVWERELLACGLRSPLATGSVSSGAFASWMLLTKRLLQFGAVDEKFLVDTLFLIGREVEREIG